MRKEKLFWDVSIHGLWFENISIKGPNGIRLLTYPAHLKKEIELISEIVLINSDDRRSTKYYEEFRLLGCGAV
jgi:hypothetical protein